MNFINYINRFAKALEKETQRQCAPLESQHPAIKKLYTTFEQSAKGGKHIRGVLVKLGYRLVTHNKLPSLLPIAAAYEILHASLLIHDDIVDQSVLRRNKPSVWKQVGVYQAMLLGDVGFFLTTKIITESTLSTERKTKAISLLSRVVLDTIAGEMMDIAFALKKIQRKEADILTIHQLKTAQYSIAGPLMLGALLGGASEKMLDELKEFGIYLGIAFQIQDDILGTFGNEKELGKSITSDIEENKNTLLITYALSHGAIQQKKFLHTHYGKGAITQKVANHIQTILRDTGALAYSEEKAKVYVQKATRMIPEITKDKDLQKLLATFAEFVIERRK